MAEIDVYTPIGHVVCQPCLGLLSWHNACHVVKSLRLIWTSDTRKKIYGCVVFKWFDLMIRVQNSSPIIDRHGSKLQIAKFMGPTWGPPGSCRPQMDPMLAPWTLLSGALFYIAYRTDENECLSRPCTNGGWCRDDPGHYTCLCARGLTGTNCETGKIR